MIITRSQLTERLAWIKKVRWVYEKAKEIHSEEVNKAIEILEVKHKAAALREKNISSQKLFNAMCEPALNSNPTLFNGIGKGDINSASVMCSAVGD